jgi:hypothetical protein
VKYCPDDGLFRPKHVGNTVNTSFLINFVCLLELHHCSDSRVLFEKLRVSALVKKFPTFYGTRKFITAFTRACYRTLFSARWIKRKAFLRNNWVEKCGGCRFPCLQSCLMFIYSLHKLSVANKSHYPGYTHTICPCFSLNMRDIAYILYHVSAVRLCIYFAQFCAKCNLSWTWRISCVFNSTHQNSIWPKTFCVVRQ